MWNNNFTWGDDKVLNLGTKVDMRTVKQSHSNIYGRMRFFESKDAEELSTLRTEYKDRLKTFTRLDAPRRLIENELVNLKMVEDELIKRGMLKQGDREVNLTVVSV